MVPPASRAHQHPHPVGSSQGRRPLLTRAAVCQGLGGAGCISRLFQSGSCCALSAVTSPQQMQGSLPVALPSPDSRTEPRAASFGGSHAQCPEGADTRPCPLLPSSNKAGQRKLMGLDPITQFCFPQWEGATGLWEGVWTPWPRGP